MVKRTKEDEELWGKFKRRFTRKEFVALFGNHPVLSGGADTTAPTYHLNFDGVGNKIVIPASASLNNLPLGDFTVEFYADTPNKNCYTITKDSLDYMGWETTYSGTSCYFIITYDGYNEYLYAQFAAPAPGPHHFEFVFFSSTKSMKAFVDGIEPTYITTRFGLGNVYDSDIGNGLCIATATAADAFYSGSIHWIRISNIARHISNFTPPSLTVCPAADANTVLRLALDEGAGIAVADTSGNDNNGTITGATWEADA